MKFIVMVTLALSLTACGPAWDSTACYIAVKNKYSDAEVMPIPGEEFKFIIRKPDNTILFVSTMSASSTEVTSELVLIKGTDK